MELETNNEIWQVESGGEIYDAYFDEMATWIAEGSLLKIDRVRKGNLRWIEAGKVPSLIEFFNAKDAEARPEPIMTMTHIESLGVAEPAQHFVNSPLNAPVKRASSSNDAEPALAIDVCSMHPDAPARYICDTCVNAFCKACPTGYGNTVKICPFCGAMCRSLADIQAKVDPEARIQAAIGEGFGFGDFANALAHPFKFKTSLVMGAIMFMLFSIGQGVVGFGGIFMMFSGLVCFLLANTLTFGVLANTVDKFSQGKTDENFMPSFEDFSLWEDVVHPFFLSIGVYMSSFGPFLAVLIFAVVMLVNSVGKEMNDLQSDAARVVNPDLPYAAKAAKQSDEIKDLIGKQAELQKKRVQDIENGTANADPANPPQQVIDASEQNVMRTQELIERTRKAQLEGAIGKTPETIAKEREAMVQQILSKGILFLVLLGATGLWGFFYFPAACAVAGYTRSFMATINPAVGIDTIRRLGSSYALILLMGFLLVVVSGMVSGLCGAVFHQFDMPGVGNIPARAVSSLFGFYISVVFSCVIGYALFKNSDKLKLYR